MSPKVQDDGLGSLRYESLALSEPKRKDLENDRMDVIKSSLKRLMDERVERHYHFIFLFFSSPVEERVVEEEVEGVQIK